MFLMHRISHENQASLKLLREKNLLPIGWSDLTGDKAKRVIDNSKKMTQREFGSDFEKLGKEINNPYLTSRRGSYLYRFLKLSSKDKVLIPMPGELWLCKVTGDPYSYSHQEGNDIGFVVPVRILHEGISRKQYIPANLSSKMKYRGTNLRLNQKDEEALEELVSNYRIESPIYDFSHTKNNIVEEIHKFLTKLNDQHFEKLIEAYLISIGADVTKIPSKNVKAESNDRIADVDVKAAFSTLNLCVYVQAKRHTGTSDDTGIRQLQAYVNEVDDNFTHLQPFKWYITTGEVDEETMNLAKDETETGIRIIQGTDFASLLVDSGFIFSNDIFK